MLESSKRPFRHPVPVEAVPHFCHPELEIFQAPAWGEDAMLYASTGWVAVRFFNFPPDSERGQVETVARLRQLTWHTAKYETPAAWRKLDDCTLDLFRDGVRPAWEVDAVSGRVRYRWDPVVRINHGLLVPLVSLQLISRLPRCEIYTGGGRMKPLAFRFNGGEGLCALLSHEQENSFERETCHVFAERF